MATTNRKSSFTLGVTQKLHQNSPSKHNKKTIQPKNPLSSAAIKKSSKVSNGEKQKGDDEEFDQLSLGQKAAEKLYNRPKLGKIYEAVQVDKDLIMDRLKELMSMNSIEPKDIIDEGLEIADAASILKFNSNNNSYSEIIEKAGQKAQSAATLMLQSQMISDKAKELLTESKMLLQQQSLELKYKNIPETIDETRSMQ